MFSRPSSFRFLAVFLTISLISSVALGASWSNLFGLLGSEPEQEAMISNEPAVGIIVKTVCDTGTPDLASVAAAVTDANANFPTGGVTYNVCAGLVETAPAGGYSLTASGALGDEIVFQKSGMGANPTITASNALVAGALNDGMFKIIGGDYVTIDGFTFLENAANTTTAAGTNNMTEWGIAVLYATTTNNSQNITIRNNTIDLNRTYQNTFGVYANATHTATTISTSATGTGAAGGNSGLKVYSNSITDVNLGIVVVGPTAAADNNDGIDIGGASVATGNTITNFGTTGTFSGYANVSGTNNGILVRNSKNFNVSFNTISSSVGGITAGTTNGIQIPAFTNAPTGTFTNNINNNTISLQPGAAVTMNGINIPGTSASVTSVLNINNNNFTALTYTVASSSAITAISNIGSTAGPLTHSISGNTFTNLVTNTTGSFTFISNSWARPTNGVANINNNSIVTGFNKTGAGGTITLYTSNSTSGATINEINTGNNFSNMTFTGATANVGWRSTDGGTPIKTVTNNTFSNWVGGTSAITGLAVSFSGSANVTGNQVFGFTCACSIIGFETSSGIQTISRNKIYGLESTALSPLVVGALISGGTTVNFQNNLIGDLRAPSASALDAIRGINITSTTAPGTNNISFNTIYLNATTSGVTFGTTGIFHTTSATATTAALNLRNNNIVNLSTPAGAGLTVAYRRSSTTITNFGTVSNNNNFYAGTPGSANLIYSDGTNNVQTIGNYQSLSGVSPRDSASISANPVFVSTTGSNANFLHINTVTPTQLESGGISVSGITDDYDGDVRSVSTPDIGADEFTGVLLDLVGPAISYSNLLNTSSTGNRVLNISVVDASGVPVAGAGLPVIYYRKNAGAYVSTQCTSVAGPNYSCSILAASLGGVAVADVVSYYVVAQDTAGNVSANPSAGAGGFTINPPAASTPPTTPNQYSIVPTASGSFNVGTGETYTSLTNTGGIFEFLNNSEITGNVTINITTDLTAETGTVALNQFSPGFTVLIKPSGAARVISGTTGANAMIRTVGASNVTIDGSTSGGTDRSLSITNLSVTTPQVVRFGSVGTTPSTNNTLKNTIVTNGANTSSAVVIGGNDGLAGYFNNVTIQNNDIRKAFVGVFGNAAVLAGNGSGTIYTQNKLDNTAADAIRIVGLYMQGVDGGMISNNTVGNFDAAVVEGDTGIWLAGGTVNSTVSGNTVSGLTQTSSGAATVIGIRDSGGATASGNDITRNTVSNLNPNSTSTTGPAVIGIENSSGGTTIQRNNVFDINNVNTGTFGAAGISTSAGNNVVIKNNFVSGVTGNMTGGAAFSPVFGIFGIRIAAGTGHKILHNSVNLYGARAGTAATNLLTAGLVVAATTSTGLDIRNNIFANNITGGTTGISNVAVALPSGGTAAMNLIANSNSYYHGIDAASGVGNQSFTASSPNLATLALYSGYTSTLGTPTNDNASLFSTGAVPFVSASDLHLSGTPVEINGGVDLSAVVNNDFDGNGRQGNLGTEIGADEIADLNAPDTSILTNPTNPSNSTSATFTFTGTDTLVNPTEPKIDENGSKTEVPTSSALAGFECSIDAGTYVACSSPQTYTGLSQGSHTFNVRAKDANNNVDPSPATYTWVIDTVAPDTTILTNPANPINSSAGTFTFSSSEVGATFECQIDGGGFTACTSPKTYTGLADGSHTFQVRSIDTAGNVDLSPASYTWVIDTVAPDTTITANPTNPTNSTTATFSFTANEVGSTFQCQIDGGGFAACTSPQSYPSLASGSHTFQVRATDTAGNTDTTPATYTWVIDANTPDTTITGNPTNPTTSTSATFTFTGSDTVAPEAVASYECKLDLAAYTACTSPQNYTGLSVGSHTFLVRAIDTAGNVDPSPASFTWLITPASVGPIAVTATAGTPGPTDYPTLKDAFDAINAGTHQGVITATVLANTTETASAVLNASGTGAAAYTSLSIQPSGGAARTVSGSIVGALVELNGADNVSIDGLNSGGNSLTFSNAALGASTTVRFTNDATANVVTKVNLQGSGDASFGVVHFGPGTATGNDGNTVSASNIGPAGINLPLNGVYSFGSSATIDNSGNTITGNNISDFFNAASASSGLNINSFNSGWTISNNKIFQTATRTYTSAATHNGINVISGSGNTITGNTIGFATAAGTGVYTMAGTIATRFIGINLALATTGTATSVQGNTVASISLATSSGAATTNGVLCGLNITAGDVNVGTVTPNTFGSTTGTGSLVATPTTTQGAVVGINTSSVGTINIVNNTFGGFTSSSPTAAVAGAVFGINVSGVPTLLSVTGNTIGNATANNMLAGVSGTTTGSSLAVGINQTVGAAATYSGNTIQNLTSFGTGTGGFVRGIATGTVANTVAPTTITNNIVNNLTTSGAVSGQTSGNTAAYGIHLFTGLNSVVSGNTITNISNINAGAVGTVVTGITVASATTPTISNNRIYGLSNASTAVSTTLPGVVSGILIRSATTSINVQNNMISLGTGQTANSAIFGIWANHGSTPDPLDRVYYNTVNVEGTVTTGAQPTAAYHRGDLTATAKSPVQDVRNNIFINNRSGGTGKHYAIANHIGTAASVATGWTTVNNNVLNGNPATIGFWTTDQTFAGWRVASGGDALSYSNIPVTFVNNATDLHLNMGVTPTSLESGGATIAGVTTDIDGQVRPGPAGSVNGGAFAPDLGADEFDGVYLDGAAPIITYTTFANTTSTTNRTLSVTITDGTGVASGGNAPRVYFKKGSDAGYVSTACSLTGGTPQNGTYDCVLNYALVGGGSVTTGDSIQYFVVAQDTVGNLSSNPSVGFSGTNVNTVTTPPTTPNSYLISVAYTGTYTVGAGGNFTSLTNAGGVFEAINNGVVTGNVSIDITSDLTGENGGVALNQTNEQGVGGYTITIKPSGGPRSITGASNAGIIRLNDADRVTIDGSTTGGTATGVGGTPALRELTVQNTSTTATAGTVIIIGSSVNGAQNNTVRNVNVSGQDPTQTLIGIALGGITPGSAGVDNDNNRIENCSIQKAFIGLYNAGASAANQNTGNVVTMNDLSGTLTNRLRRAGMLFFNHDGLQVSLNSIGGITSDEATDAYGIGLGIQAFDTTTVASGAVTNSVVSRNRINGLASTNTTGFTAVGIGVGGGATGANVISNNMITGVNAPSTSPDLTAGIYVSGAAGSVTRLFFNSVSMTGDRGVVASQIGSYALAITGVDPTVELKNNIFYTTQTSGGGVTAKSYAIGMVSTLFTNLDSNYNDFVSTGANAGGFRTGGLGATATDTATLGGWQTLVADDPNSQANDPTFTIPASDLHLLAGSPMISAGIPSGGITVDFDGNTRDATPDIGADEFVVIAPGTLALSSATYSTSEANSSITITVNRSAGTDGAVGATYALTDGTATGAGMCGVGIDYVNTGGTVAFANGVSTQTFNVTLCPDALNKVDETFNVTLSAPTGGATIGSPGAAVVTITNDDVLPSISINDVTANEGDAGTTSFGFTASLSAPSGQTVTVQFATADGTATIANNDYASNSGTVTFNPGETTKPVTVLVNGDTTVETNEDFFVNLTTPTNATILDAQGQGNITNDDSAAGGAFSVNDVRVAEGNAGTVNATFTVTYTAGGAANITFATANRTATAGTDYVANTNTLTFPASGSTQTQTVNVVVNGDIVKEANETFEFNLSAPTGGATITDGQGIGIIVDEDRLYVSDFDDDAVSDFSVYRPSDGTFYTRRSTNGTAIVTSFGLATDRPVPGDYDNDGKNDIAIYRPSNSTFYILNSSSSTVAGFTVGVAGDKPVQGDYNGDGRTEVATFRPSNGLWSVYFINNNTSTEQLFGISTDRPVQGDYDGDAKTDLAVYRDGTWYVLLSSNASVVTTNWGISTDKPVSGDFDGDGKFDYAIYRNGQWWVINSLNGNSTVVAWGISTDIPAPADFDGDGTTDVTVFRPSSGDWYVLRSSNNTITGVNWGLSGDIPMPSAVLPQ